MGSRDYGSLLIEPVWDWNHPDTSWHRQMHTFNRTSLGLKHRKTGDVNHTVHPFNRTSLGLKLLLPALRTAASLPFNRTSLGLKRANLTASRSMVPSFNRTSLGLKLPQRIFSHAADSSLLIEPVWDWNAGWGAGECLAGLLLIEPVWDWNLKRGQPHN